MIHIKKLTVKNFMSVGNATQGIDFNRSDLTLVLGENLDLGGDGSRNGTGKTTSTAKLAQSLKKSGASITVAAADTFRAAATEQIQTWGERIGVPVVAGKQNGDSRVGIQLDSWQVGKGGGRLYPIF